MRISGEGARPAEARVQPELHRPETSLARSIPENSTERAATVEISAAGRDALAAGEERELTTGHDVEYRVYGPGDAHYGKLTVRLAPAAEPAQGALEAIATESDQFETTSPGHKHIGEVALGGSAGQNARHDAAMAAIQNTR